jgi:hypothetical protein
MVGMACLVSGQIVIAVRAIAGHIPSPTLPSRGESITRATFQCAIRAILR